MYGHYLKETLTHDPAFGIEELQIVGKKIEEKYNTFDTEEMYSLPRLYDNNPLVKQTKLETSPSFSLSEKWLLFDTVLDTAVQKTVELENTGCCALQYEWIRLDPITELQKQRADSKFLLSERKGVILPQKSKTFVFSFESEIEGIFTDGYRLETTPKAFRDCDEVYLKGVVISNDENDVSKVVQKEETNSVYIVMSDIVNEIIDNLPDPKPPKDNRDELRKVKVFLLQERFIEANKNIYLESKVSSISQDLLQSFYFLHMNAVSCMGEDASVTNKVWDYSLLNLRTLIQRIGDEEKRLTLLNVLLELMKVLEKEQHEKLEKETRSLQSKIRSSIMYEQLSNAIDEILDTASFLEETIVNAETAKRNPKDPPISVQAKEERQQRYKNQLELQAKTIFASCISRVESQWDYYLEANTNLSQL